MSFFIFILIGQAVAIFFVVFVLKVVLNNMLIDLAVRHIEVWKFSEAKGIDRILILSHKPLKKTYVDRIKCSTQKTFSPNVFVDFQIQKSIWGGAVIRVGDQEIDCSLKDRFQQAIRMK